MVNQLQEVQWAYLIDPCFQIENTAGRPNTGGWINIYIAGTRTKYYAASDFTGTLHPFNIPLDSLGSNIILVSPANKYDIYVVNKFGNLVMSRYNVSPQVAGTSIVSGGVVLDSSDGTITIEQTGDNVYDLSVADIIDSVTANIDESITNIEGDITEINQSITGINQDITEINQDITNITNVVTGLPTHADLYDSIVTGIEYVTGMIPEAQVQSDWDESDPTDPAYILNKPDLDNYVTEQELIEVVSGISGFNLEYGQFYCQTTTGGAVMGRTKGNIEVTNDGKIKLKKGQSYHVTVRGGYSKTTASADYNVLSYIEYITGQNINVNVDNSVTDTQYFEISYDIYRLSSDKDYYVFFSLPTGSSVNNLFIEIHSIGCMGTGGSGSGVPVEYDAGWGINIIDNVISVDPSILNQYVTEGELATAIDNVIDTVTGLIPEAQVQADWDEDNPLDPSYINNKPDLDIYVTHEELASAVSGLAPEYTAGDNIEIDNDVISVSNPTYYQGETDTGYISVGNITHWNEFTEAPGIVLKSHTSSGYPGGETDFEWHVTPDHAHQVMAWGDYDIDYETNTVSATKYMTIGEGDIVYASGAFQDTNTLPVIWSCSQMARDISELQGAITAVTGVSADNIVDYDDADLFDKVEAIYNDGRSPIVRYTYSSTPGQGFPYTHELYFTEFTRYSEDNEHGHTNGYRFNYERNTGNYIENELIHFNSDGVKEHTRNTKNLTIMAGDGISVASGAYDPYTIISIDPTEVATAISGLLPAAPTYSAGDGIDITDNTISVADTVALKSDIPDISNFVTETELQDGLELVTGLIPTDYATDEELQESVELVTGMIPDVSDFVTEAQVSAMIPEQEEVEFLELVAGANITITESATGIVISSTGGGGGGSYTAGNGIDITNDVISVDNTVALKTDIPDVSDFVTEQEVSGMIPEQEAVEFLELTAGDYIDIASGVISVTGMPDITGLATKTELQDGLELVTGLIPTDYATIEDIESAVSGKSDKFTVLTYNSSTWSDFTTALAKNTIVLCKYTQGSDNIYAVLSYYNSDGPARFVNYNHTKATNPYTPHYYRNDRDYAYVYELSRGSVWSRKEGYVSTMMLPGNGISESYNTELDRLTFSINPEEVASSVSGLVLDGYATEEELQDSVELVTGMIPDYTAGNGIDITNDVISVDNTVAMASAIPTLASLNTQGITDIQLVNSLPESPVSTVIYLIPEA